MDPADHLNHLRADIDRMLAVPDDAYGNAVANCPGWTVKELMEHVAGVYAFATNNLAARPGAELRMDVPVAVGLEGRALFERRAGELLDHLEEVDPTEHRPNWAGLPTAEFYFRRMAQESAVHRWDAQLAVADPEPIPTAQAVDGVDELFEVFLGPWAKARGTVGEGESVHLHATDAEDIEGGEWTVTFVPDGVDLERAHAKAQMAAKGTASDLLLFAWNRRPVGLDVFGEPDLLDWWPDRVAI